MIRLPLTDTNRERAFTTFRHLSNYQEQNIAKKQMASHKLLPVSEPVSNDESGFENLLQALLKSATHKSKKATLCIKGDRFRHHTEQCFCLGKQVYRKLCFAILRLITYLISSQIQIEASCNQFAQTKPIAFLVIDISLL